MVNQLHCFDIDSTLFKTTAQVILKTPNDERYISPAEFKTYSLKNGETYDFREFSDAELFFNTSVPIEPMISVAKESLDNKYAKTIIITARSDLDDKHLFLKTFEKHGLDPNKLHVYRAGNIATGSMAIKKKSIIDNLVSESKYNEVKFYDDHHENLTTFLLLKQKYPLIMFKAFHVNDITITEL